MAKSSLILMSSLATITFLSLIVSYHQTFRALERNVSATLERRRPPQRQASSLRSQSQHYESTWDGSTPPLTSELQTSKKTKKSKSSKKRLSSISATAGIINTKALDVSSSSSTQTRKYEKHVLEPFNVIKDSPDDAVFTIDIMYEHGNNATVAMNEAKKNQQQLQLQQQQQQQLEEEKENEVNLPRFKDVIARYTTLDISRLARVRPKFLLHLLVFDGQEFRLLSMSDRMGGFVNCPCQHHHLLELVIDGLLTARPHRFAKHMPLFQVLLATVHDNVHFSCMEDSIVGCSQQSYPPLLTFGSVPKNTSLSSFLQQLPTKYYNDCLFHHRQTLHRRSQHHPLHKKAEIESTESANKSCLLRKTVTSFRNSTRDDVWNTLIPQVFWRGSQLNFLRDMPEYLPMRNCLTVLPSSTRSRLDPGQAAQWILQEDDMVPRCRAAAMSLLAESNARIASSKTNNNNGTAAATATATAAPLPWINVKFVEERATDMARYAQRGAAYFLGNYTSPQDMAQYKYQVDLGGMGGTTWLGTITKLAMPGLLFHHDTPTKDWFYDEIQPWVHYVPIHTNLSNFHDMFIWAETHPEQARQIAKQGQEYAQRHITHHHMEATFDRSFVQPLGAIVDAYRPRDGETFPSILQQYQSDGLFNVDIATCHGVKCKYRFPTPNNIMRESVAAVVPTPVKTSTSRTSRQ